MATQAIVDRNSELSASLLRATTRTPRFPQAWGLGVLRPRSAQSYAGSIHLARRSTGHLSTPPDSIGKRKNKYFRGSWNKNARLQIGFYAKGTGRAQIALQENKLANKADVELERAAWKKALGKLQEIVG